MNETDSLAGVISAVIALVVVFAGDRLPKPLRGALFAVAAILLGSQVKRVMDRQSRQ